MANDAASGWILDELEDNNAIPKASDIKDIVPDSPDGFVNLLVLDMDAYAEKMEIRLSEKSYNSGMVKYFCRE